MAFLAKGKMIAAAGAAVLGLLTGVAQAAAVRQHGAGFEEWKADFAKEARAAGVKSKGLAALAGAKYATGTIKVDRAVHKAFSGSVEAFMQRRGASAIISKGRSLKKSNAALFNKIESTYGVPPGVLLAIWGMETGFGASMGKQNTVSAIVTLAYDCRRPAFFTPHAIASAQAGRSRRAERRLGRRHAWRDWPHPVPARQCAEVWRRQPRTCATRHARWPPPPTSCAATAGAPAQATAGNMGAIAGWNSASVYQQAIARIGAEPSTANERVPVQTKSPAM